jgi:hypothetical protein
MGDTQAMYINSVILYNMCRNLQGVDKSSKRIDVINNIHDLCSVQIAIQIKLSCILSRGLLLHIFYGKSDSFCVML